ncbi:hypothetical protein Nocox_07525 [Nonomuraea coxensis DSM 45129]|uniref:Uncharacterized protein n=1 Tax=Nonomuraea coxensis DSM 45129 TaxID=1122611 RepID=A0ABX8TUG9_9ACTN|nr:hypothetical protein [Nonomuraea coxensis]QYC39130.1 hypothetical protein Nocox_07525 [Nonomuraea coxensis DSM 45129]
MCAPRPTNSGSSLVLLARLTGSSAASPASTVLTVYLPSAAVQVPRVTGAVVAPGAIAPLAEPVRVRTTVPPASTTVSVTPCAAELEATVPWFLIATLNVTVPPAAGLPGVQATGAATRSAVSTGRTVSVPVVVLLASLSSVTSPSSSTLADSWYVPASRAPMSADTVADAPAASAPTAAAPTLAVPA